MFNNNNTSPRKDQTFILDDFNELNDYSFNPHLAQNSFFDDRENHQNNQYAQPHLMRIKRPNLMFTSPNINFWQSKKNLIMPSPIKSLSFNFENQINNTFMEEERQKQSLLICHEQEKNIIQNSQIKKSIYEKLDFGEQDQKTPPRKVRLDWQTKQENQESTAKKRQEKIDKNQDQINKKVPKGLRKLSEIVRDIVYEKKESSYKQVADILIKQLQQQKKISRNSKDELNVKRRVYDALNVLISAGVLKKEGKNVTICIENERDKRINYQQKNNLSEQMKLTELNIAQKYEKLIALRNKFFANQYLINRNKETKIYQQLIDQSTQNHVQKIHFPFIGIITKKNSLHPNSIFTKNQLKLIFKNDGFKMIGDIDAILKLKFHEGHMNSRLNKEITEFNLECHNSSTQSNE